MAIRKPNLLSRLKERSRPLRREVLTMYLAIRHPATPWYAKVAAGAVVAYAVSPLDVIPDFIPIVGLVDDLLILPLGFLAVRRMIPVAVLERCREQAAAGACISSRMKWAGGIIIGFLWLVCLAWLALWLCSIH